MTKREARLTKAVRQLLDLIETADSEPNAANQAAIDELWDIIDEIETDDETDD
jgi:hypothetical protein